MTHEHAHPKTAERLRPRACWSRAAYTAVALVLAGLAGPAAGQLTREDILELRNRGEVEGWTFTVGENPATGRPLHELCGAVEPPDWQSTAHFDPSMPRGPLPTAFDWRNHNGQDYCTPIRDQGACGSCWAFGATATVESAIMINEKVCVGGLHGGTPCTVQADCEPGGTCENLSTDLSEQWLVSCIVGQGCNGSWHTVALDACMSDGWQDPCGDSGAVLETDFPYVASNVPCGCPYPHPYSIYSWAAIGLPEVFPSVDQIKQAILDYGPVVVAVDSSSAAFSAYTGGVFNACVSTGFTGHVVALVGWDDNQGINGVWILRNSWDTGWGEGGYMRIEYECCDVGYAACYVVYGDQDCNNNGIPDRCDLSCSDQAGTCNVPGCGLSSDCNRNRTPDDCEVALGLATDHNANGVPDDCEKDCNDNGVPDECDLSCGGNCAGAPGCGQLTDCQPDGTLDVCQLAGVVVPPAGTPCSETANNGAAWCDDFESYALGAITGNNWDGWGGNPSERGLITTEQNHTFGGTKSIKIIDHDTVRLFNGYDLQASPHWVLRVWVYIPSAMTGEGYLGLAPDYVGGGPGTTSAATIVINTLQITDNLGRGFLPSITDQWAEFRCEINFPEDLITVYYQDQYLGAWPWSRGGGSASIAAVNLFSYMSSGLYFDDVSLFPSTSVDANTDGVLDECVSAAYTLKWWTIDGGGVTIASGGDYTAGATVGQPDVGKQTGGDYTVLSGFWPAAAQMACANDAECDDGDVCTWDQCIDFWCVHVDVIYGDVNANGVPNVFDIFCMLDLIAGSPVEPECDAVNADIEPCSPNGTLNVFDLIAVLNSIAGQNPCNCPAGP